MRHASVILAALMLALMAAPASASLEPGEAGRRAVKYGKRHYRDDVRRPMLSPPAAFCEAWDESRQAVTCEVVTFFRWHSGAPFLDRSLIVYRRPDGGELSKQVVDQWTYYLYGPRPARPPCLGEGDAQRAAADYVGANLAFKLAGKPIEYGWTGGTGGTDSLTEGCRDAQYQTDCTRQSLTQLTCTAEWLEHVSGLETPDPRDDDRQRCRVQVAVTLGQVPVAAGRECFEIIPAEGLT